MDRKEIGWEGMDWGFCEGGSESRVCIKLLEIFWPTEWQAALEMTQIRRLRDLLEVVPYPAISHHYDNIMQFREVT